MSRYGIATDRCGSNPAPELRGALKKLKRIHYTTIEKGGFPQLLQDIDSYQGSPLTTCALQLMAPTFTRTSDCRHLFPNRNDPTKPASKAIILRALGRMGYTGKMTGHGFRSTASTMLNEYKSKWDIHRDVIELQLAHVEKHASRAAYNFAEYLDERRAMLQQWAD